MSSSNKPIIAVVGATGLQGSSVINAFLSTNSYHVRGLTRNPTSANAQELASRGVEIVKADLNDYESILAAFKGASVIFGVTDFFEPFRTLGYEKAIEIEEAHGKTIALAASNTPTLTHYIWSTLPNASKLTGGKFQIPHFIAKNRIDAYIKSLPGLLSKTTFFWISFFANNYTQSVFTPFKVGEVNKIPSKKYIQISPIPASTPITTIGSASHNIGVFALAIVKQPALTLPGKFVLAATETLTNGEVMKIWGEVTGREAVFVKVSFEDFEAVWPGWGREMGLMVMFWEEAGERTWGGEDVVTGEALGIDSGELVGLRETFASLDWE